MCFVPDCQSFILLHKTKLVYFTTVFLLQFITLVPAVFCSAPAVLLRLNYLKSLNLFIQSKKCKTETQCIKRSRAKAAFGPPLVANTCGQGAIFFKIYCRRTNFGRHLFWKFSSSSFSHHYESKVFLVTVRGSSPICSVYRLLLFRVAVCD